MQLWITGRLHSLEAPWLQRATPASVYDKLYLLYHIRSTLSTDLHRPALCSQCKNRRVGRGVAFKVPLINKAFVLNPEYGCKFRPSLQEA